MTTKNFNAKKVLMSAVAAVVFSFVFTTNANADPLENTQRNNLEIRVKTRPNGDKQEQKQEQNKDQKQEQKQENKDIVSSMLQMFGVRV